MNRSFQLRGPIRRILVMRPRALGDVLMTTPTLRAIKQAFPAAELHFCVDDTLKLLLQNNPHIDKLWCFPRKTPRPRWAWFHFYRQLLRVRFDLVIDLHGSPRTAVLTALTRAPHRVGYDFRGRRHCYNFCVPRDTDRHGKFAYLYSARTNLEILARCGVDHFELDNSDLVFEPRSNERVRVKERFASLLPSGPTVGLSPAGTWMAKTWPMKSFARCADMLVQADFNVLLLWGPGEEQMVRRVTDLMQEAATIAPATNIEELAILLEQVDLLISNDSGIKHLAVARSVPTLTLFGPTEPRAWMPESGPHRFIRSDIPCVGCNMTTCSHHLCMRKLAPETVVDLALDMLQERSRGSR